MKLQPNRVILQLVIAAEGFALPNKKYSMPLVPAALPRCAFYQVHAGLSLQFLSFLSSSSYKSASVGFRLRSRPIGFVNFPLRTFHSSGMAAKIDGTAIAKSIREGLKTEIEKVQLTNPRFKPNLVIFQGKHCPSTKDGVWIVN